MTDKLIAQYRSGEHSWDQIEVHRTPVYDVFDPHTLTTSIFEDEGLAKMFAKALAKKSRRAEK